MKMGIVIFIIINKKMSRGIAKLPKKLKRNNSEEDEGGNRRRKIKETKQKKNNKFLDLNWTNNNYVKW